MRHAVLLLFSLLPFFLVAQTPNRVTFRGTAVDSAGTPLVGATVMLLVPKDSTLVNFGRSNDKGAFEFKNVRRAPYLLKITYVGYLPYQRDLPAGTDEVVELGTLKLKPIAKELMEVVIRTAKAPLTIRGDTVEYNATSFKVPPGSTVEDLLRKLPGMQVEQDGTIRAQGQEVRRVTVDGKNFFGTDPKLATKNLPADAIQKVQVFTDKSEQAKITGVDDGKKEKAMNLELKESARKGGFGKVTAGAGGSTTSGARGELKGNYNRFNQKQQFSLIGLLNNTNQTGVNFNDYQDFRGSQSFNWNDNGDFGFSNAGGVIFFGGNDDEESFSVPIASNRGQGFSNNGAGGANYNYDTKKTKLSSNYFYNQTRLNLDADINRENFIPGGSVRTQETNSRVTFNTAHRGGFRLEQNLDSLNTLLFIGNGRANGATERYTSTQDLFRNGTTRNGRTTLNNLTDSRSVAGVGTLIFRHKFAKKGRNFAASLSYSLTGLDGNGDQRSENEFSEGLARTVSINQFYNTQSQRGELKSSLFFLEPLSKKFFWESFYNFSLRNDEVDRDVFDRTSESSSVRNTGLSRYYTNRILYNRLGSSLRYSHNGLNLSAGLAGQQFDLDGQFTSDQLSSTAPTKVDRRFFTWVPNASLNYDLKRNRYLYSNYTVQVRQPSTRDLQPVVDNSNPRFIREGNPDLLPQVSHNLSAGFSYFNPGSFTNLFTSLNYTYHLNQIVNNQTVDTLLVTRVKPGNLSGGTNMGGYMGFGFPLKKTKSALNLNTSINFGKNLLFVNDVLNRTNMQNVNVGLRLDLTPSEKFTLYTNANAGITNTRYSVNTSQNQRILNYTLGTDANVQLPRKFYVNANFNYRQFINRRFGFDQRVPILNLAVYKLLLKENKGELRLTVYDVFNQNRGVTQSASLNFVSQEQVRTLARYALLSFTYNMRGVKAQMRRGGGF